MKKSLLISVFLLSIMPLNAQTWSSLGTGLSYPVNSICYFNNNLYAAGGGVYQYNGSQWLDKSSGMIALMDVYTLAVFNGNLFAGGFFTVLTPEQNWYNNAARFSGGSWTTCGNGLGMDASGMTDYVNYMFVYGGQLYAGGRFGAAGGDPLNMQEAPFIARFDGSIWHPVGSGMDYTVTDLCEYNGNLVASGFFTIAGGITANYIAKWNGSAWSAIGSGMDAKVTALAVYNGELYAGGLFTHAGGNQAYAIAKWNGSAWSPVGGGITGGGQVYTLAVYNGALYAGGTFNKNAGNAGDYIMKWNGSSWLNVGDTDGPVIFLYPSGNSLFVGGNFSTAGGHSSNNIAVYTNTSDVRPENIITKFSLDQNYPNPFNPSTKIIYSLQKEEFAVLKVYNTLGREVSTLVNSFQPSGTYEVEFSGNNLPAGIYFYTLNAGNFSETKKMILIK